MRNPAWSTDELILALDLYFRVPPNSTSKSNSQILELSETLNRLPIHPERPDAEKFRNPNGVYMKMCNFLRFDPNYSGVGLKAGAHKEQEVWTEFANDLPRLRQVAAAIRASSGSGDEEIRLVRAATSDEIEEAP